MFENDSLLGWVVLQLGSVAGGGRRELCTEQLSWELLPAALCCTKSVSFSGVKNRNNFSPFFSVVKNQTVVEKHLIL